MTQSSMDPRIDGNDSDKRSHFRPALISGQANFVMLQMTVYFAR
jgi:hypothetical protein